MRLAILFLSLLSPLCTLATSASPAAHELSTRQDDQTPVKPQPCQPICPEPSENVTKARFEDFAYQFIVAKNITAAFTYIDESYINHNPLAQNGFDSAWDILSPIWAAQNITPMRTLFIAPQGWLNYNLSGDDAMTVVDRYRWEGGCIAEHWDQGEVFPCDEMHIFAGK